jgi:iron(III) transport system substrate-binding protein
MRGAAAGGWPVGWLIAMGLSMAGCAPHQVEEVVVYTALDEEFSRPILDQFTQSTGIAVRAKFDVESTKTVGLTQALMAERERPRADLFWNNEIVNTLRLERAGLLGAYRSSVGSEYPPSFRSAAGTWYGFAARARVLLVNTDRVAAGDMPGSVHDLLQPRWRGQVGIAKPLAGTTATHAACLFAKWGSAAAQAFWRELAENTAVLGGNKQVARAVAEGRLAFGLTDTDDALGELERGMPVEIVFPDQGANEMGTLLIPNTLAVIRGGPHGEAARRLLDFLLSPEVEAQLSRGASGQIPLHPRATTRSRVLPPGELRVMEVDFAGAAASWDEAATFLRDVYAG